MSKENEFQSMNRWVPATPNESMSSRGKSVAVQFEGPNMETTNWQQVLGFPDDQYPRLMSYYQPVQDLEDLDPHLQSDRNGCQSDLPSSFMALLGVHGSYDLDDPLLESQGISVSEGYPSIYGNLSEGVGTSENSCAGVNPLPMASQFVAHNSSQSPQSATQNRIFQSVNRPVIPNDQYLITSACNASKDAFQLPEDGFVFPSQLEYYRHLPAKTETEASFSQTSEFFQHTLVTPNQPIKFLDNKQYEILELPEPDRHFILGGDKHIRLAENGTRKSYKFRQPCDETSYKISTPDKLMGNDREPSRVNNLSETPQHKTPKRRKHRPKVVREGQPKKIPKSETLKNSKSSERPKRKYTRKISSKASEIQPNEVEEGTGNSSEATAANSCKRALSFELQKTAEQREANSNTQAELLHQMSERGFNFNSDKHATVICCTDNKIVQAESVVQMGGQNELPPIIGSAEQTNILAHSMPQGTTINRPRAVRPPPTWATTVQDLLVGNIKSAGSMKNSGKATLNPNSQPFPMYTTEAGMAGAQSVLQCGENKLQTIYQHTSITGNFNHSMPQQTTNTVTHAARYPPKATTYQELLIGNWYCAQSTVSPQNVNVNQTNQRSCYNPAQSFSYAENTHENLDECDQMLLYRSTQPMMITSNGVQHEARRSKRERDLIGEQQQFHSITPINSSMLSRVVNQVDGHSSWYVLQKELQEAEKKQRTEHIPYMRSSLFNPYPWTSYAINISHSAEFMRTERVKSGVSILPAAFDHSSKLQISSDQPSYFSQLQKRGNPANVQASPSLIPVSESNLQTVPAITLLSDSQQITKDSSSTITTKHYSRPTASGLLVTTIRNAALPGDVQEITTILTNRSSKKVAAESSVSRRKMGNECKDHQPTSSRKRGQLRKKDIRDLIDDIIYQMEHLKLDDVSENAIVQPENAIVPFKEGGPVVMYQAKKRKPRPKVDLDHESQRMWKQLTGKDGTEGVEGTDTDKEKWWEDERKLFGERASLFIGRMHLVQGDRQFSRWKGSVVDSVVGVFLTQSVTDVVSSSAFMDLAARFPLNTSRARCSTDDGTITEDPEICIIDLENAIPNNDSKQALSNGNPMASKIEGKIVTSDTEIMNSVDNHIKGGSEENLSLDSVDAICLTKGGPYFRPDSEVDDQLSTHNPLSVSKTNKSTGLGQGSPRRNPLENQVHSFHHSENAQQPTVPSCDYQLYAQLNSSQRASLKDCQPLLGGESMSSCPASHAAEGSSNISGFKLKNRKNLGQNGKQRKNTEPRSNLNEQPGSYIVRKEGTLTPASIKETTQHSCNDDKHESVIFHSDRTSAIEETEPILREHGLSGIANINSKDNNPKTRRRKQDADKKLIDWDILRKEAQRNNRRSSNKDAMDSINYETMRHTDVKEIADTIRKRGMNSMLAERIKDFLNRMVTDHGSIDLEWLRDVPPEKAKDYLLSIRGLGLKSTECVRLLTLHHLAFPVDTNVGRIAVRLGWVPLQPLPESLELHLLEMYPVLETIQMYLWPRLCKLDQRTLYELHYQMITFGKVFCTKSKPNCNACPMRAECRHFASAFASARLALPGPEERDTVPSGVSVPSDRIPAIDISFQPLLELDNQLFGVERSTESTWEPTVELPATPEQEPEEASEFDIEDLFGEDPDEFPAIKLNFQDLKSHMRENNLDVQGDEMSKALVALTAEAASLPPQKLKNASRLRTEHQVYELPDSHPLLCKMDRREPDDPSPYLLAIWMPGETAYSTQPPESEYQSEDPCKMCSEKTCFSCNSKREADSNIVRGTLLIPCRTAMRGSFPLNGTYFQVNEMFADHESSMNPIDVPREYIWSLPRRTVYFGTAVSTVFKGMSTEEIQYCFWRGFVCVRGFDQRYRAPRPLLARLHGRSSKLVNKSKDEKK